MLKASQKASDRSWQLIQKAFAKAVLDTSGFTLCYGTRVKNGLFSTKIFNYAIGFRADTMDIVVVPIDSEGDPVNSPIRLRRSDVTKAHKTLQ